MKRHIFFALALAFSLSAFAASSTIDSLLNVLESEIAHSSVYIARHKATIDSLCALRPMTPELQLRIAREYQHFQCDSSRAWYLKLSNSEDPVRSQAFVGFVKLLASSGRYDNALALLKADTTDAIHSIEGYKMAWLLYSDVAANTQIPNLQAQMKRESQRYYDAMMETLADDAPNSQESYLWLNLYRAQDKGDYNDALYYSEQLLALTTPDEHLYAILAYGHAMIYESAGNESKRLEWLIRSSITDVRCGITDNGSSWIVAQDLYDAGDLKHAYSLSDYSLSNAMFFNAPTRFIQNFTPGHLIASRYDYELRRASIYLIIALILLAIVLVGMVVAVLYILRQNHRLHTINSELKEADKVKEQYICRYLEVYNDYIRRLTTMARKAGERDASAFMDREMENFYRSFDDTFLSLYGSFVQDFNALLKPEARITPKPGERLTIEMRIYALILLGITSSSKIGELLCYSPNTISNYRVKMKKGAIGDRDTFEQRVQQIGRDSIA